MNLIFQPKAWDDYCYWQKQDKRLLKRINLLIKDMLRTPYQGLGEPKPLKHNLSGLWSRRIDKEHRLIYCHKNNEPHIIQCRYHY